MRSLRIGVAAWVVCTGLAAAQSPPQLIPRQWHGDRCGPSNRGQASWRSPLPSTKSRQGASRSGSRSRVSRPIPRGRSRRCWAQRHRQGCWSTCSHAANPALDRASRSRGQAEQPRRVLATVPYALKAGDANTVGGPAGLGLPPELRVREAATSGHLTTGAPTEARSTADRDGVERRARGPYDVERGLRGPRRPRLSLAALAWGRTDGINTDGSLCAGFDCVNGENFGFDTIRVKDEQPADPL